MSKGNNINYDELLNNWSEKVLAKAEKYEEEKEYTEVGSFKYGYLKGLAEGYRLAEAMLAQEERKEKKKLNKEN